MNNYDLADFLSRHEPWDMKFECYSTGKEAGVSCTFRWKDRRGRPHFLRRVVWPTGGFYSAINIMADTIVRDIGGDDTLSHRQVSNDQL